MRPRLREAQCPDESDTCPVAQQERVPLDPCPARHFVRHAPGPPISCDDPGPAKILRPDRIVILKFYSDLVTLCPSPS
ncbi:hypothetical protein Slala05_03470 [Streptomyces lavendulae subsp. lavendulae]|nr:hypothetical protein Slala05_03470 [Streptomyces lavendulae subsp. lavendulae]